MVPCAASASAPRGSKIRMTCSLPPKAPTGMPPPMVLPMVVRSASMPCSRLPAADVQAIGDRLVEDEQGAVLVREPQGGADELRVAGLEDVTEDRLEKDGGRRGAVLLA